MPMAGDDGKLDLFKPGKRFGKFDSLGHKGPSDAPSLVIGSDVYTPYVTPVLLFLPGHSEETHQAYQLVLEVSTKREVVRRLCGHAEPFGYEFQGVRALELVGGTECIRVFSYVNAGLDLTHFRRFRLDPPLPVIWYSGFPPMVD